MCKVKLIVHETYQGKRKSWSAAKSVDTDCGIICIENEGEQLCQAITQNTQQRIPTVERP